MGGRGHVVGNGIIVNVLASSAPGAGASTLTLVSFIAATAFVGLLTIFIVKRMKKSADATVEYFTGGRSLGWIAVGGSLMLTNLSTEQLVGLNGAVFGDQNLAGLAWEAMAALAMIVTAVVFLPRYLASGFTTTPAFLEKRFDKTTRSITSGFFLLGYVSVLLPVVLYTGSLALKNIFDLDMPLEYIVIGSVFWEVPMRFSADLNPLPSVIPSMALVF